MKFTVALVTLALTVAGAAAQTTGMSLNSHGHGHDDHGHHGHDPNPSPTPTPDNVPPYRPDVTTAACSSSIVAQLIGISALNCLNLNVLSSGKRHEEEPFKRGEWIDPVLENLKARHGFHPRGICESSVAAKLIAIGALECGDVSVLNANPTPLDSGTCSSSEVSLLASVGILNCAKVSALTSGKRDIEYRRKEEAHKELIARVLAARQCNATGTAKLISGLLLSCDTISILSDNVPTTGPCSSESTAQLISLAAGNCDNISILSGRSSDA